jgi:hypothetical protein
LDPTKPGAVVDGLVKRFLSEVGIELERRQLRADVAI